MPRSLLPSTFFAENGFLQLMICLLLFYCLSSFFQGNISQSYLRTEGLGQGIYGDALVDSTFKNYLDSSSCCSCTEKMTREEAMGGNRYWRQRGAINAGLECAREEAANCLSTSSDKLYISTNQEARRFSRKILSFIHPC